jgi:hypothetical protein
MKEDYQESPRMNCSEPLVKDTVKARPWPSG